ncbi:MAG: sugar ABC transporter ATP-binding protein [Deltaproteobacteria bacterium]
MSTPFLVLDHITKLYPGVKALDGVSLSVSTGEVIGLAGENGAGKSTLMKVLGGVTAPSSGQIILDGTPRSALSVPDAIKAGIAFVHQELNLFDNLDVAANVYMGREPLKGGPLRLIDRKRLYGMVQPVLDLLGCDFRAETLVAKLSLAQRQMLEISKALSQNARLVIMDEPTSSLTLAETDRLLNVVENLRHDGVAVIFITHRLNELARIADRVVVLRDGKNVGDLDRDHINHAEMIKLMIGRDLKALYTQPAQPPGATFVELTDVKTTAYPTRSVSLALRSGEILGLAGLVGSGRTELARAIFGIDRIVGGEISVNGAFFAPSPKAAIEAGIFLVPEDRKQTGLLLDLSIAENIALPDLWDHARRGFVSAAKISKTAERMKGELDIRSASTSVSAGTLSGGNQQKVVLAKWLALKPKLLICDEPTRGIDVGAKAEIYILLRALADSGVAILMISSDMEEVIGVSDRVAVMQEGRIGGILTRDELSEHAILTLATGPEAHPTMTEISA